MYIDTHCHIYTEDFDTDREQVIDRARKAGAKALLLPNIDGASIEPMLQTCRQWEGFCLPMLGLHPTELPADPQPVLERMERMLGAQDHPYVAVGEVGIDLYWDSSRRAEQISVLRRQAEWAVSCGLPLMIHSRSAHRDIVETLRPLAARLTGVFHCFGGTADEAAELLRTFPGFVLGIGGVVTFKKSTLPHALQTAVPLDRIVVETDSPWLAPAPHRGTRNEPAHIPLVLEKLSAIYGRTMEETEATLMRTTLRIFPKLREQIQIPALGI